MSLFPESSSTKSIPTPASPKGREPGARRADSLVTSSLVATFLVATFLVATFLGATSLRAEAIGHWPLDDGAGIVADDVSSQNLDGTVEGTAAPQWLATGAVDGALELDGVDDLVVVQDPGASPLDLQARLTLAVWIRPSSLDGNRSVISKDGAFELDLSHAGVGSYSVRLNNTRRGAGTTVLVADAWQHVAVTWDGATVRYYFQGQPDGIASFVGALQTNDNDLGLGGRPASYSGGSPQFLLTGALDDARIYDRALTEAEIAAVYQNQPLPELPPDADPPARSNGNPTGTLPYGTTDAALSLLSDESAECRYADGPGVDWSSMIGFFDVTGGSYHEEALSGLQNGVAYTFYVRCRDVSGNENPDDYAIAFDVDGVAPIDDVPPLLSEPSPLGTVAPGTSQVNLALSTDEDAECRYSETADTDFDSMVHVFDLTGGQSHSTLIPGLQDAESRIFYVRCRDQSGNAGAEDFPVGFWVAAPAPGSGFHPTDLDEVAFFVESRHGLGVATCATQECRDAGDNVPMELQYCDTDTFPFGCVRRWEDQSVYAPPLAFEPPEWTTGRDFGQDDLDKPGLVFDCLNGRPCIRGGVGEFQDRSFEIEPNQNVEPTPEPFSLYLLAKPVPQPDTFYYLGFAGSELLHNVVDNSLRMRIDFGSQVQLTGPEAVPLDQWHLVEVHREADDSITTLVNGYDLTFGEPSAPGNFYFRFLFTVSRDKGFYGDLAAALVAIGELSPTERTDVRQYFADVYGLAVGDGNPPDPGKDPVPTDGLVAEWTFDDGVADCVSDNGVDGGADAAAGPSCPGNGPADAAGYLGTAVSFDGVDDELVAGADPTLDLLGPFTVSTWIRTTNDADYLAVVDKRDASDDGFDLYLVPGGRPFLRVNNKTLLGNAALADGEWHHVVGYFDGSRMRLYVDGALDSGRPTGPQTLDTQGPLVIGRNWSGTATVFDGELDQVRIYDRDLTGAEITALHDEE